MTELTFFSRFYAQEGPNIDDVVIARIRSLTELGVYVNLLEYNGIEGMLQISELSRRRIRSLSKLTKVGKLECLSVIRVEENKSYIDLSKRRVTLEDILLCRERYARAKSINSVLHRAAEVLEYETNAQFQDLYNKTAWHFDKKRNMKTASFDVFHEAAADPTILNECDIDSHTKNVLLDCIKQKLLTLPKRIRAVFQLCHFGYEGIDAIKEALCAGLECSTDDVCLTLNLISHPAFTMNAVADEQGGIAVMNEALAAIEMAISRQDGVYKLICGPEVVKEKTEQKTLQKVVFDSPDRKNTKEKLCGFREYVDNDYEN